MSSRNRSTAGTTTAAVTGGCAAGSSTCCFAGRPGTERRVMPDTAGLVVAALGGAAVGLERQWSGHADGPEARFAGIRTFTLLGVVAGLSGWLSAAGLVPAATALL